MNNTLPHLEPIPPAVQAIVDLFNDDLDEVNFPDVNAQTLAAMTRDVQDRADALAEARDALELAQKNLADASGVLLGKAERALAYATVFAEEDETLTVKISGIAHDARKIWGKKKPRAAKTVALKPEAKSGGKKARAKKAPKSSAAGPILILATDADEVATA